MNKNKINIHKDEKIKEYNENIKPILKREDIPHKTYSMHSVFL